MNLRTFRARNLPEAMRQLRAELGEDAIIVASRELAAGEAQVTAAVEDGEENLAALLAPAETAPVRTEIAAALAFHGVPAPVREALEAELDDLEPTDAAAALAGVLARRLRFDPLGLPVGGRTVALVGPPGAGKTAAVARLAAAAKLAGRPVLVRSADTARAGGVEQLKALLAPLKLVPEPVPPAGKPVPAAAGDKEAGETLVLLDTTGVNPFRGAEVAALAARLGALEAEPVLVLPAGLDVHDAVEIVGVFAAIGARRCLVTRLDAARRLGAVVAAGVTGVALAEASVSPLIGQPLLPLSPGGLARLLLRHGAKGGS